MSLLLLNSDVISNDAKLQSLKYDLEKWIAANCVFINCTTFVYDCMNNVLQSNKLVISSPFLENIPFVLRCDVLHIYCAFLKKFSNSIICESLYFSNSHRFDFSSMFFNSLKSLTLYHCDNVTVDDITLIKNISEYISLTSNSSFVDFSNYKKLGLLQTTNISLDMSSKDVVNIKNITSLFDNELMYNSFKITNFSSLGMPKVYITLFRNIEKYINMSNRSEYVMDISLYLIDNNFENML